MTTKKQEPDTTFEIADKKIDIRRAFPLTIGDYKQFGREGIVLPTSQDQAQAMSGNDMILLLCYLIRKAQPQLTEEEVDSVPMERFQEIAEAMLPMLAGQEKATRPTQKEGSKDT